MNASHLGQRPCGLDYSVWAGRLRASIFSPSAVPAGQGNTRLMISVSTSTTNPWPRLRGLTEEAATADRNFDQGSFGCPNPPRPGPVTWADSPPPESTPPWRASSACFQQNVIDRRVWATREQLRIAPTTLSSVAPEEHRRSTGDPTTDPRRLSMEHIPADILIQTLDTAPCAFGSTSKRSVAK